MVILLAGELISAEGVEKVLEAAKRRGAKVSEELASLRDRERQHIVKALARARGVLGGSRGAAALMALPCFTLQYRIDMVVEGAGDVRLAIECDGDEFPGPDRWPHDMARQRLLERAGWTFWRCFASTWHLRKDEVLAELIKRLTSMDIERLGAVDRMPQLVEKRTIISTSLEPEEMARDDSLDGKLSIRAAHRPAAEVRAMRRR